MNGKDRRTFEMTGRTVNFNDGHPDTDAGNVVSAGRLKDVRARMEHLAADQRTGLIAVHTASLEKERIQQETLATPIAHVAEIGKLAAKDQPQLAGLFRFKPSKDTQSGFLTAARSMLKAALEHKEVLAPYGLSDTMLELMGQLLDQFDAAVKQGADGRGQHAGATRELGTLAKEARQIVRAMNARNRYRFKNDQQTLGAWIAASTVVATPVAGSEPDGGPVAGSAGGQQGGTAEPGGGVRPAA
jgi:hypothetical protein